MSNTNQEIIESRLATYIDGELDANERLEIEQHLQQNPQYKRLIDDLRKQRDMLRVLPREAAPPDLAEAFTNQLERSVLLDSADRDRPAMRIFAFPRIVAAAAIVVLTFGLAGIVYHILPDRGNHVVAITPSANLPSVSRAPALPADRADDPIDGRADDVADKSKVTAFNDTPNVEREKTPLQAAAAPQRAKDALTDRTVDRERMMGRAAGITQAAMEEKLLRARDTDLDQLAQNVSNDALVQGLLTGNAESNARFTEHGASPANARVVVVRADNPRQLETDLAVFFNRDNINWQPAPRQVELAVNTSLSRKTDEAIETAAASNRREIDAMAIDGDSAIEQKAKKIATAKALDARPASAPALAPSGPVVAQNAPAEEAQRRASLPVTRPEFAMRANLDADKAEAAAPNAADHAASFNLSAMPEAEARNLDSQQRLTVAANAAPIDGIYIARRLSRQQIDDLNFYLASGDNAQAVDQYRRLGEFGYKVAALGVESFAQKSDSAAAARPAQMHDLMDAAVPLGDQTSRANSALGAVGSRSSTRPVTDAAASDGLLRKGDNVRLSYDEPAKESQAVKVKEDGTITSKGATVFAAGKTVDEVARELKQGVPAGAIGGRGGGAASRPAVLVEKIAATTPALARILDPAAAPAPAIVQQPVSAVPPASNRAGSEGAKRSAVLSVATTQPALAAAGEEMFDVVIVVQKNAGGVDTISAPHNPFAAEPTSTSTPALLPATQPAPAHK